MKKRYILTVLVLVLIVGAVLLILFLPRQSEEPTPSTEPYTSLATIDSEILNQWGQQAGDAIREYYSLYFHFEEKNTVFTNELFEGVESLSFSFTTVASKTISGMQMRLLMQALCELQMETTNEFRTNLRPDVVYSPRNLILNYENGETLYVQCFDLSCTFLTLNSDGLYEPVEPGVYYALTDESIRLDNLILPYFPD